MLIEQGAEGRVDFILDLIVVAMSVMVDRPSSAASDPADEWTTDPGQ